MPKTREQSTALPFQETFEVRENGNRVRLRLLDGDERIPIRLDLDRSTAMRLLAYLEHAEARQKLH